MTDTHTTTRLAFLRTRYATTGDRTYISDFYEFLMRSRKLRGAPIGESWR